MLRYRLYHPVSCGTSFPLLDLLLDVFLAAVRTTADPDFLDIGIITWTIVDDDEPFARLGVRRDPAGQFLGVLPLALHLTLVEEHLHSLGTITTLIKASIFRVYLRLTWPKSLQEVNHVQPGQLGPGGVPFR